MIPQAEFGATGHSSSRVIFGAAALGAMRQDKADTVLELVTSRGINHLDTAASYGDSELRLAPLLATQRENFFLATKTGDRSGRDARASLERSLERLGTDRVDLIQLHNLVEPEEWEVAFGPGGAVEAMFAARDEGLCRFVGVTGHGFRIAGMHIRSVERAEFASVLLPFSYVLMQDPAYRSDVESLFELCEERSVAIQTIKSLARRRWTDPDARKFSWYEPLDDADAITRSVQWVLSHPNVFLNSSSDARWLEVTLDAAEAADAAAPARPSDDAMAVDCTTHGITPLFDWSTLERI